jgi:hypothetical protein
VKTSLLALMLCVALPVHADLVVSLRYFKSEGTSHFHLFLYKDDGKLVRQLTSPEDAHDTEPIFSASGSEIAFTRETKAGKRIMSIRPDGTDLRTLPQAPAWYRSAEDFAYELTGGGDNDALWKPGNAELSIVTPDGRTEVKLKDVDNFKIQQNHAAHSFGALAVRNRADRNETRVVTMGDRVDAYCDLATRKGSPFLLLDGLRALFYWQWGGSTAGPRLGVLDLDKKKAMFLSENPAVPVPHGSRSGFFVICEHRYQPLPGTKKTVNCVYLDWWNAELKRTRFAKALSLFGGASVGVKGQPQLDIPKQPQPW